MFLCISFINNCWKKIFTSDSLPHWCKVSFASFELPFSEVMSTQLLVDLVLEKCLSISEMCILSLLPGTIAHIVAITLSCCHWSSSDKPTPPKFVCMSSVWAPSLWEDVLSGSAKVPVVNKAVVCCSFTVKSMSHSHLESEFLANQIIWLIANYHAYIVSNHDGFLQKIWIKYLYHQNHMEPKCLWDDSECEFHKCCTPASSP